METKNEIEDSDNENNEVVLLSQSIEDFINRWIVVLEGKNIINKMEGLGR